MTTNNESIYPGEFNGYPTYDDVINPVLRAWNRINTVFNMKELLSNDNMAAKYVAQFPAGEQMAIAIMANRITKDGYENTRRSIMKSNNQ